MTRFERAVLGLLRAPSYPLTVRSVEDLTPHYRRVRFSASELLEAHDTPPTFWLRVWVPAGGDTYQRAYTVTGVRRDEGTLAMEFALHDDPPGLGSTWARAVTPGTSLAASVFGSKQFAVPQPAPPGYLLLGDPASLPAINDVLRALPGEVRARVLLERHFQEDAGLPVEAREHDEVTWVDGHGGGAAEASEGGLPGAVRALDPADLAGWHAWVATETGVTKRLRTLLRDHHGLDRSRVTAQAYWIRGRPMGRAPRDTGATSDTSAT